MVDAGPKTEWFDAGDRLVAPKLRRRGVSVIDVVFLTHPDADHIGGLPAIARRFKIGIVAMPDHYREDAEMIDVLEKAGIQDSRRRWLKDGTTLTLGASKMIFRFANLGDGDNSGSLMIRFLGPSNSTAVLTADAGEEQELSMLGKQEWSAQVLKAGHHGSGGSTSEPWLRAVRPRYVVVSCGRDNQFGHPAQVVLDRSAAAGAAVLRTDLHGDLVFTAGPEGFRLVGAR